MGRRPFFTLFIFYIAFTWFWIFGKAILPPIIASKGLNLVEMMFAMLLVFIAQAIFLVTIKKHNSKKFWPLSILALLIYIIGIFVFKGNIQFYIISFISGLATPLFYISYNFAHFNLSSKEKRGERSALMFGAPLIIAVITPLLAGFLAQNNPLFFWILLFLSLAVVIYFLRFQEPITIKYSVKSALTEIKATRILIFLSGIWETMVFGVIPIYTIFFIKTPLEYGTFLAYISLMSVIANYILGKISDKIKKRAIFLYALTPVMAFITFLFPMATSNLWRWIVLTGAVNFLLPLFWSVSTAFIVDTHQNLELTISGREIMLTAGRIIGLGGAFLSFLFEAKPFILFIFLGGAMLLFPLTILYNSKISKKYFYA